MRKTGICIFIFMVAVLGLIGQEADQKCRNWIIPRYLSLQYAGGIGNYIIGAGYTLNKSQSLRLALQYGFTPKYKAERNLHTTSLKISYLPVKQALYKSFSLLPVISLGTSRVFADGPGTFTRLPSYYPDGYYAPNAFRLHFSLGGAGRYELPSKYFVNAIELHVETTTNDLYVKYYFYYEAVKISDIFSLSLAVNIFMGR